MLIQSYEDLRKGESEDEEKILKNNLGSYKTIVIKGSTYNIEEKDDIFILTNPKTGNVQRMSQSEFGNFMNAGNSNMGEIIMYEN